MHAQQQSSINAEWAELMRLGREAIRLAVEQGARGLGNAEALKLAAFYAARADVIMIAWEQRIGVFR